MLIQTLFRTRRLSLLSQKDSEKGRLSFISINEFIYGDTGGMTFLGSSFVK